MGKYEVAIAVVSVPGPVRKVPRMGGLLEVHEPEYYRQGEIVELKDSEVKGHVAKGYLKPVSAKTETSPEPTETGTDEETGTDDEETGTDERLTEKQRLIKEAEELGLDSSGTVVDLKNRIEQHKAGQ